MDIVEYDAVDPLGVLHLNLLCLGYALTPERVALIRQLDPRPFPFFAVYAVEDGTVIGQVAVYRLPMVTAEGPEDIGGVCAVCTHPAFSRRGIATRLLDEAHIQMRAVGLRFSTLGTARYRVAHMLYQKRGYDDVFTSRSTFACRNKVWCDMPLRVERANAGKLNLADDLFQQVAAGHLGFARRHKSFIPMLVATGDVGADEVWLLWNDSELVGYVLAKVSESVLSVDNLLLTEGVDAASAVSAVARDLHASYFQVRVDHPSIAKSLRQAGYLTERSNWSTFMIKPLIPEVTIEDACRLFGIGTEQFLISPIDVT